MNAKQRRVFARALHRCMDHFLADCYGKSDLPRLQLAPRFRGSERFWRVVERCEDAARGEDRTDDEPGDDIDDEGLDPYDDDESSP